MGVRVVVPFGPRTIQGYVMDIQQQPSEDVNIDKLKAIKEIRDIRPELTPELIQLSEWLSHYHISKRISVLEAMLQARLKQNTLKYLK